MAKSEIIRNRKFYKRNKILSLIRYNENLSRNDVKKLTLYSIPTVREIIDELIADGLVYEVECEAPRVGRRPIWLKLNPQGANFIGVEFNGDHLYCVMLDFIGNVIRQSAEAVNRNATADYLVAMIERHVKSCLDQIDADKGRCFGICVGVPGYYDKNRDLSISYSHLPHWRDVPIRRLVEARFGLPCYIENNVNVMAFAYKWLYYHGEAQDFIFVSMRTGVRMVPVVDNNLILSQLGFSGQLGHIKVPGSSRLCSCGKFGCLNSEVSEAALIGIIRDGIAMGRFPELQQMAGGGDVTIPMLCRSIGEGHPDACHLMRRTAGILGDALGTVVNIFAPEVIVLSGALAHNSPEFIMATSEAIRGHIISENLTNLNIVASAFGQDIGAIGAAAYVMQEEFEFIDKPI